MSVDLVSLVLQKQAYIKQCDEQMPHTHYCLFAFINSSLHFTMLAQQHGRKKIHITKYYIRNSPNEAIIII